MAEQAAVEAPRAQEVHVLDAFAAPGEGSHRGSAGPAQGVRQGVQVHVGHVLQAVAAGLLHEVGEQHGRVGLHS